MFVFVVRSRSDMTDTNPYAAPENPLLPQERVVRPRPTMIGWGRRYMLVGAFSGLILPLFVFPSTIPPVVIIPIFGAVIGFVIGCVGGAFSRWTKPD